MTQSISGRAGIEALMDHVVTRALDNSALTWIWPSDAERKPLRRSASKA